MNHSSKDGDAMINRETCLVLIKELENNIQKRMNYAMKELDMTLTQGRALDIIWSYPGKQITLKQLEKELQLAQSVTAGIIKRLEQKEFVKSFGDAEDKRIKIVQITPLGEKQYHCSQKILFAFENEFLSCLTEKEQSAFNTLLKKVKDSIK